jgi:hypothetical protein
MSFYKTKLAVITFILLITGCREKDELTIPVNVQFKIGISQDSVLSNGYLSFNSCQIGISDIWMDGRREAGEDVYFQSDIGMYNPPITCLEPIVFTSYDLPQGVYESIKWSILMEGINLDLETDLMAKTFYSVLWNKYDPWDFEGFPGTVFKTIFITGSYKSLKGSVIPTILALSLYQPLNIRSYDPEGNSTIVLTADRKYEATLLFGIDDAFSSISRGSIENAEVSEYNGLPVIIISDNINTDLYESLMNRILISIKVIFK